MNDNNTKVCCFTGHRNLKVGHLAELTTLLDSLLTSLIQKGVRHFKAGGAIGFDTVCALKVLELKNKYPEKNIILELCLPCRDQTNGWSEREKKIHSFIAERADKIDYAVDYYTTGCMHIRNQMLVNGSDICVAYLDSSTGGTAYTCSYAISKGLTLINTFELLDKSNR